MNEAVLVLQEKALGPDHPGVAVTLNNMAGPVHALGGTERALVLWRRAKEIMSRKLGDTHPHTQTVQRNLNLALKSNPTLPIQSEGICLDFV